jgi:outer membrane protein
MRKLAVALVAFAFASSAFAAEGPLMVRARYLHVAPQQGSKEIANLVPKDGIAVEPKNIPEVDFTYFVTPNIAAELILTFPQAMDVTAKKSVLGPVDLGSVTILPPCLTVQYHVLPSFGIDPYVGVGANLTLVTKQELGLNTHVKPSSSIGFVAQAGADLKLSDHFYFNIDVKYVTMSFDVKDRTTGTKLTTLTVDPFLYAVGLGYRI